MFDLLGKPIFALAAVAVAAWLVRRGIGPRAAVFVVLAAAGLVLNAAAKSVFGVTPLWQEIKGPQALANFPSGHVFYAVVLGGALARLAHLAGRRDLVLLAAVPVVLMGPMRVIGGAHLAGDVLAGYLLGAAWLCVCVAVFSDGRALWTSR
jgi:undecaprenyl-diphosphatase